MTITVSKFLSLSHCRTEGTTLEEPCLESTELDRGATWRRSLWRATKVYIGPIILFLAYSFSGAALFHHLESQNELDALGKYLLETCEAALQLGIIFSQKLGNGVSPKKFSEFRKPDKITETSIGVNKYEEYWWMYASNFRGGCQFLKIANTFHGFKKLKSWVEANWIKVAPL